MKRTILIYGLVIGTIYSSFMVFSMSRVYSGADFEGNEVVGYAVMILVFSMIFVGVRNYRNRIMGGSISFGKAFRTGALIAVVASTIYVLTWLAYYYLFIPDFMERYTEFVLRSAAKSGASEEVIAEKSTQMAKWSAMYKNPLFVILLTYTEILPIGLLVSLVSAFILKKR